MQDLVTSGAEPFCAGVCNELFRDLRLMTALMPTFVASITENNNVFGWAVPPETMLTKSKLFLAFVQSLLDLGMRLQYRCDSSWSRNFLGCRTRRG